jgi:hypothetical protein
MNSTEFNILDERLKRIESLLLNIQPKKRPRQTKIVDVRGLADQMMPYKSHYAQSILHDFWLYWSEKTVSGKERWQLEKVFDVGKRLEKWKRNEEKWQWEKEQREALKKVNEKPQEKRIQTRSDED